MNSTFQHPLHAFGNHFEGADRDYSVAEQFDLAKLLGYAKTYFAVGLGDPAGLAILGEIPAQRRRTGLGVAGIYAVVDFSKPEAVLMQESLEAVRQLMGFLEAGETLELAFTCGWMKDLSGPSHDETVARFLRPVLEHARPKGLRVSLYHHLGFWLERIDDCVRLAAKINDPALRVSFSGYHWFVCGGKDLGAALRAAQPWLALVSVCGARRVHAPWGYCGGLPASIETVGEGEFPLLEFVRQLRAIGFRGDVGFQAYKLGGYPPVSMAKSLTAWRAAERADANLTAELCVNVSTSK